jgi:hypothetical protein
MLTTTIIVGPNRCHAIAEALDCSTTLVAAAVQQLSTTVQLHWLGGHLGHRPSCLTSRLANTLPPGSSAQPQLGEGLPARGGPPDAGAAGAARVGQHTVDAKDALQGCRPDARRRGPDAAQARTVAVRLQNHVTLITFNVPCD